MFLNRFVLLVLGVTAPLCAFAQDPEPPAAPAPVAESTVDTPALVPLGQTIFGRLVSVLPDTVRDEVENPCPLENEMPKCFDADFVRRSALQPIAIDAASESRVLTLQVIEGYIDLVAAVGAGQIELAEEQTGPLRDAIEESAAFGEVLKIARGIVEAAVPVPQALTDTGFAVISELITRIRESQNVEEQSEALLAGATIIESMIVNLIEETPRVYEIYRLGRNDKLIALEEELVLSRLGETTSGEDPAEDVVVSGNGTAPESEEASPTSRPVAAIEADIAAVRKNVRQFHKDLTTYVVLLDQRRTAIKVLVETATQMVAGESGGEPPPNSGEVAVERVRRSINLLKKLQVFVSGQLD